MRKWIGPHYSFSLTIIVFISIGFLQRTATGQDKVNVKLIKEIQYPDSAKQIIFNFKDSLNPIPKIAVFDKKIVFYDDEGNRIFVKEYNTPIGIEFTPNKKFLEVGRFPTPATKNNRGVYKIDLLNDRGDILWKKQFSFDYEGELPHLIVSNNGNSVLLEANNTKLVFMDKRGNVLNEVELEKINELSFGIKGVTSNNGYRFVIGIFTSASLKKQGIISKIMVFDNFGKEVWSKKLNENYIKKMFISEDDRYLLCSTLNGALHIVNNRAIYLFNLKTGKLILHKTGIYPQQAIFYKINGKDHIIINSLSESLIDINISSQSIERIYIVESGKKILGAIVDKESNKLAIIEARPGYAPMPGRGQKLGLSSFKLMIFDIGGKLLASGKFPYKIGFLNNDNNVQFVNSYLIISQRKINKYRILKLTLNQ